MNQVDCFFRRRRFVFWQVNLLVKKKGSTIFCFIGQFLGGGSTNDSLIFHAEDTGTSCCVGLACFCVTNVMGYVVSWAVGNHSQVDTYGN